MSKLDSSYDLIIIGAGPGGIAAAGRANKKGLKTLLINGGLPLAGTCLNVGCIPSKYLIYRANLIYKSTHLNIPGVNLILQDFDFKALLKSTQEFVDKWRGLDKKYLDNLKNVTFLEGLAKFASQDSISVNDKIYKAKNIIIASGGKPRILPIEGLLETGFLTNRDIYKIHDQPKELLVIGAGSTGLETAQMYARFGTKVTIFENKPDIYAKADKDLSGALRNILEHENINIITDAKIVKISKSGKSKKIEFTTNLQKLTQESKQELLVDEIFLASGEVPNIQDLCLDNAQIEVNEKDKIIVNGFLQVNFKNSTNSLSLETNIYAIGDVAALPKRLETTASQEGRLAVENIISEKENRKKIDYSLVPTVLFTDPQLAQVGLCIKDISKDIRRDIKNNINNLKPDNMSVHNSLAHNNLAHNGLDAKGIKNDKDNINQNIISDFNPDDYEIITLSFDNLVQAQIRNNSKGLIKLIIHKDLKYIAGAEILAYNAEDIISIIVVHIKNKTKVCDILEIVPVFPSVNDALQAILRHKYS